jgi:hypothetical protein
MSVLNLFFAALQQAAVGHGFYLDRKLSGTSVSRAYPCR